MVILVGDEQVACGVHGDAVGIVEVGAGGRAVVAAEALRPVPRHGGDHPIRDLADAVAHVGDVQVAGESTATPRGQFNWALVAGPLSPLKPGVPFPATVVITPFETLRMRWFEYRRCTGCRRRRRRRQAGKSNWALVAGPLSPLKPCVPFPATVVITPLETLRMRWLEASAMYRLPAAVHGDTVGVINCAPVAGPLSPLKPCVPLPATVVITPFETLRMRWLARVGDVQVAGGVHGDAVGIVNWALVAGPLSPLKPRVPLPATVVITPFETLRMRWLYVSAMYRLPAESTATPWGVAQLGAGGRAVVAAEALPSRFPPRW